MFICLAYYQYYLAIKERKEVFYRVYVSKTDKLNKFWL